MALSAKPLNAFRHRGEILVVDDDQSVRDNLCMILELEGFQAVPLADGHELLARLEARLLPECIVLDVQMPGISGLEVLKELAERDMPTPVIMISGVSDVPAAVDAMKSGARDFIVKPFLAANFIERLEGVVEGAKSGEADIANRHGLTPREQKVLFQIAQGSSNKEAGRTLGISPRTVEVHRAHVMSKLGAKNTADLMRIILSHAAAKDRRNGTR